MSQLRVMGVRLPMHSAWAQAIASGAARQARRRNLVLEHIPFDRPAPSILADGPYLGIIASGAAPYELFAVLEPLISEGIRCMQVSTHSQAQALMPTLVIDAAATGRLIAQWARQQGFTAIATTFPRHPAHLARLQGLEEEWHEPVHSFSKSRRADAVAWTESLRDWWQTRPSGCLLVCEAPMAAMRCYRALADLRPPIIVAEDDPAILSRMRPRLSAVQIDFARIGSLAVDRILDSPHWPPNAAVEFIQPTRIVHRMPVSRRHPLQRRLHQLVDASFPHRLSASTLAQHMRLSRRKLERALLEANLPPPATLASQRFAERLRHYLQHHEPARKERLCRGEPFPSERALNDFLRRWQK